MRLHFMNPNAGDILFVPLLIALVTICRGGKWHWDPIPLGGPAWLYTPLIHRLVLLLFWLGWGALLIVGLLKLFGLA